MDDRVVRGIDIVISSFMPLLKASITFTVPLAILSFGLGLMLAFLVAMVRILNIKPLVPLVKFYVWIIRGTPLLLQLFIIFYGLPSAGITLNAFISALIGFTLNVGAYNSETIRGALLAVPKGQWEAGKVIGLSPFKILKIIIIPQGIRTVLPSLSNSFIGLIKDTSLAAAITYTELFQVAQQITARTYEPLLLYAEAGFIYLIYCTGLSYIQKKLELRFGKGVN